jgi:SepF-like predicted cell division protein (DUF552 family)
MKNYNINIKYMNITLDLSKGQLSKLRNGHGIRINPTMLGSGTDLIIDPMTYHNMSKKMDKGKGVVIKMGSNEIEMNKMEGTGLFAGAGNQSGKISRIKKANKWRDFSVDTAKQGIDVAKYGYDKYKEATNPVQSKLKKMFGFGDMEDMENVVEGGMISMSDIKKSYNKNVKNTKLGKAIRETAEKGLGEVYDKGVVKIGNTKHFSGIADVLKKGKVKNVSKLTQMSGLGLRLQGDGVTDARFRKPITLGDGLTMGGKCCGCGMMNDKFLFQNQSL